MDHDLDDRAREGYQELFVGIELDLGQVERCPGELSSPLGERVGYPIDGFALGAGIDFLIVHKKEVLYL
jgi:hypothetical protein